MLKEQDANQSKMNLQYLELLEEVKNASSINLNKEQCIKKYSKHSSVINEHLNSLKEGVKSVYEANLKNAEKINQNIEEGVKQSSNHSEIFLNEIKVFKDEVLSHEEVNRKQKQSSLIMGQLETLEEECKSKQNKSSIFKNS